VIRLYFQQHFSKNFILLLRANTRTWGWGRVYNDWKKRVSIPFSATLLFPRLKIIKFKDEIKAWARARGRRKSRTGLVSHFVISSTLNLCPDADESASESITRRRAHHLVFDLRILG
jgi:hypothetical protein